jgi:GDP-D-mannose 3', 5'-epimerase
MDNKLTNSVIDRLNKGNVSIDWYDKKHILVTGGAGFIGSWLVETLTQLGAIVYVVDNLWRGSLSNLKSISGEYYFPINERFILGDLREYSVALEACKQSQAEIIFHFADIVAGINYVFANEPFVFRSNMLINSNVVTAAHETNTPQLVYLGTACSYPKHLQKNNRRPLVEEDIYPADPESAYGWSKLMGEYEINLICQYSNIQTATLRLQNVYGPRVNLSPKVSQVIPSLIRKALRYPKEEFIVWGSGKQSRDFIFVTDVIDAILRTPLIGMGQGAIQIATSKETTIAEIAKMIVKISGKEIPIIFDQSMPEGDLGRSGSYDKAKSVLGWDIYTSIEEGLRHTYEWAYSHVNNDPSSFDEK